MIVVVAAMMLFMNQHTLGHATNRSPLLRINNPVLDETPHAQEFGRRFTPRTATTPTTLHSTETQPVPTQTPYSTSSTSEDAMSGQKSTDQEDKGCLKLSYDSVEHIYRSENYVYDIWLKSVSAVATIQLDFDFSVSALNLLGSRFKYSITSDRWHRLQVFRSELLDDCTSAQLRITDVAVECLPHRTPSLLRVSSGDNRSLVVWSTCSAQGPWWDEVTTKVQPLVQTSTELYMWLSLGLLIILVPLAIYASCLQYRLIKGRSAEPRKESIYEEWNYSRQTSPPCSSNDSNKFTVQTSLSSI
ncbi:uncharacterized protein LOC135220887 [Macrobrachium nipponense]|uniref:uncharacterized protein LOC135220887 n=1 Tax=Macrobrachium nipponense TaxID=159736 RepID=UPI0030C8556C